MKSYDIPEELIKISPKNFTVTTGLKPEYVLKVNNIPDFKTPKNDDNLFSNPNPENLPAIIVKKKHTGAKIAIITCMFLLFFALAVIVTYKGIFYLFTI